MIVHAHPQADSFVAAMRGTIRGELTVAGYVIAESDLYAMGFNPTLSPADFPARRNGDHLVYALEQRHGCDTGTLPADIMAETGKVPVVDLGICTFPAFWFGGPEGDGSAVSPSTAPFTADDGSAAVADCRGYALRPPSAWAGGDHSVPNPSTAN